MTKNPALARGDQILALPTLVRRLPPPLKRIIGDLSNAERVLIGLDLRQPAGEVTMKTRPPRRARSPGDRYVLRLYVTGQTPRSTRAVENLKRICEEYLEGRYDLEVIDLYQQPELARTQQIVVAPTLIKTLPEPVRKILGDLSDKERVLAGLDLQKRAL